MTKKLGIYFQEIALPSVFKRNTRTIIGLFAILLQTTVYAAGIVGNGTPGSCSDAALTEALSKGGTVTFNCGNSPVTITISEKKISANTLINGNNRVTLSGGYSRRLFNVASGKNLSLKNLVIANARTAGQGAVVYAPYQNYLSVIHCQFKNNIATQFGEAGGGVIYSSNGSLAITGSKFTDNKASVGGAIRVLNSNLSVEDSTFTYNKATDGALGNGGAIYVDGAQGDNGFIDIRKSTFKNNTATAYGGALFNNIYNNNKTTISNSFFSENYVGGGSNGQGGAIWSNGDPAKGGHWVANTNNTTLNIANTTLANNTASQQGGGIWIARHPKGADIRQTAIYGNKALKSMGGGIVQGSTGKLSLINSTVSDNKASGTYSMGAGIYVNSTSKASILNTTIAGNVASWQAGGIFGHTNITLKNTILANNIALNGGNTWDIKHNCAQPMADGGNNLQYPEPKDAACTSNIMIANPKLESLKNNGGVTLTHAILPGSNASRQAYDCPAKDQRGVGRTKPAGTLCDIGAFEAAF